jgi:subtilisin-like proprotein convertase family protein
MRASGMLRLVVLLVMATTLSACLTANLHDNQFTCQSGLCPDGFMCVHSQCVRPSIFLPDMGMPLDIDLDAPDQRDLHPVDLVDDAGRCVPDELEPNNSQNTATRVGPGTNLLFGVGENAASLCPGDEDWYTLTPVAPTLNLLLQAGSVAGVTVELRSARGAVISTAAAVPGGLGLRVDNVAVNDPLFIRVSGAQVTSPLAYGLLLSNPANDLCEGATELPSEGASFIDSFLTAHNDYDPGPGGCTHFDEKSPDLAYHFKLDHQQRVLLNPDSFGNLISLYLLKGAGAATCDSASSTCVAGASSLAPDLRPTEDPTIDTMLDPGDYYMIISVLQEQMGNPPVLVQAYFDAQCGRPDECTGLDYCVRPYCAPPSNPSPMLTRVPSPVAFDSPVAVPDGTQAGMFVMPGILMMPIDVATSDGFSDTDRVGQIEIGVWVRHTWRGDLTVKLTSPPDPDNGGQTATVTLISRPTLSSSMVGYDFRNDINELFPFTTPSMESLTAFNGAPIVGRWMLEVDDAMPGDTGELVDVSLYLAPQ